MRTPLVAFVGIIWTFNAVAQITITINDMPVIGTEVFEANDTIPSYSPGSNGTNQIWDFSSPAVQYEDTVLFLDPTSTPGGASFPSADLAAYQTYLDLYMYFDSSSVLVDIIGVYGTFASNAVAVPFNPTEKFMTLPSTYQSAFSGTRRYIVTIPYTYLFYDQARVRSATNYSSNMDGWGQVTIPSGTFDCLRQLVVENTTDSLFMHNTFTSSWDFISKTTKVDTTYRWLANGQGYPVAQYIIASNSWPRKRFTYMKNTVTGITAKNETLEPTGLNNLLLNPEYFEVMDPRITNVCIFETTGKMAGTIPVTTPKIPLYMENFTDGIYRVLATGKDGEIISKRLFLIAR